MSTYFTMPRIERISFRSVTELQLIFKEKKAISVTEISSIQTVGCKFVDANSKKKKLCDIYNEKHLNVTGMYNYSSL